MKKSGYLDMYFDKEAHKYGLVLVYDDGSRSDFVETGTKLEMLNKKGEWVPTELIENDAEYGLEGFGFQLENNPPRVRLLD